MSTTEAPQLEPVRDDGIRAIQIGLGLWVVAGLVLLVQRDELADRGTQWWLAVCAAGFLFGLVQLAIFSRRRVLVQAREGAAIEDSGALGSQATGPGGPGRDSAESGGAGPTG